MWGKIIAGIITLVGGILVDTIADKTGSKVDQKVDDYKEKKRNSKK